MDIVYLFLLLHYLNILSQTVALGLNILKINKTKPLQKITCMWGNFYHDCPGFHFYSGQPY